MKNLIRIFLIVFIFGSVLAFGISCSEENNCSMTGRPMINCTFYKARLEGSTKMEKDTLDSLTITSLETNEIILNNEKQVKGLTLPLRYTKDTTVFVLHYNYPKQNDLTDTIYVTHTNDPFFQSLECGYQMKQEIKNVKIGTVGNTLIKQKYQISSISVINKEAKTNEIQNLQIFYKIRN